MGTLVIAGSNLILIPYTCCRTRNCGGAFAVFWLLVLVISPVVTIDWASFMNAFPLVISHWPIVLGLLGFGMLTCTFPASMQQDQAHLSGISKSGINILALDSEAVKHDLNSPRVSRIVYRSAEDEGFSSQPVPYKKSYNAHMPLCQKLC